MHIHSVRIYPKEHEQLLYELKLAKLKESLQSGIDDAEKGVFADYSLDGLMQDLDQESR